MTLLACMCNQPQRLGKALAPVRTALVAPGPVSRWGLGYVQAGEVLLSRTPRSTPDALDLYPALSERATDCVIAHTAHDGLVLGTHSTQPYRFRRWMLAQDGAASLPTEAWSTVAERVPDFLRRNLRGRSVAELTLHVMLALLHDQGVLDDPNLAAPVLRRGLTDALALVHGDLDRAGLGDAVGDAVTSNSRSLALVRPAGGAPVFVRRLHVFDDRDAKDESFRGVLLLAGPQPPGDGAEEVPPGSVVTISRDLRVDISPIA